MFGNKHKRGDSLDLYAAIEVVLAGGSKLQAGTLIVSPGKGRGTCSITEGRGEDLILIGIQYGSIVKFAADLQPSRKATLVISGMIYRGERREPKRLHREFQSVSSFEKWCSTPEARTVGRSRWSIHLHS